MLDRYMIPVIRRPLAISAHQLVRFGVSANQITVLSFIIGLLALPLLAFEQYLLALMAILVNRIGDGLDGAVARLRGISDAGGFLDIVLDFLFYSAVIFGFVLANPETNAVAGAFLIFAFVGTGSSFLAFASVAGKLGIDSPVYKQKSLYYMGGLTEGTETIAFYVVICLLPGLFSPLAWCFGLLCWLTTATRIWTGYQTLKSV